MNDFNSLLFSESQELAFYRYQMLKKNGRIINLVSIGLHQMCFHLFAFFLFVYFPICIFLFGSRTQSSKR